MAHKRGLLRRTTGCRDGKGWLSLTDSNFGIQGKANHKYLSEISMQIHFMSPCPPFFPSFISLTFPLSSKIVCLLQGVSWEAFLHHMNQHGIIRISIFLKVCLLGPKQPPNSDTPYLFMHSFAWHYELLLCSRALWISGRASAKPWNKFESYPSFRFRSVTLHPDSMNRTLSSQGRGSITGHFLGPWICTMRYPLQSASTMLQWLSRMTAILMPFNVDPITHPAELNKMILSLTSLITQSYFKTWN